MADSEIPKSWEGAIRWLLGGTLVFAAGFEAVVKFVDGELERAAVSLLIAILLIGILLNWDWFKSKMLWTKTVNVNNQHSVMASAGLAAKQYTAAEIEARRAQIVELNATLTTELEDVFNDANDLNNRRIFEFDGRPASEFVSRLEELRIQFDAVSPKLERVLNKYGYADVKATLPSRPPPMTTPINGLEDFLLRIFRDRPVDIQGMVLMELARQNFTEALIKYDNWIKDTRSKIAAKNTEYDAADIRS